MNDSQCDFPLSTMLLLTLYNNGEECEANILLQVSNLPQQCQAKETNQVKKKAFYFFTRNIWVTISYLFKWCNS